MGYNIYDMRRYGKVALLSAAAAMVAMFLYYSSRMVKDLSEQERQRMEIWADATKDVVNALDAGDGNVNIDFPLGILNRNTTIPVLLTDDDGNILQHRNFNLPGPVDPLGGLSPVNEAFLKKKLEKLSSTSNVIHIAISEGVAQHLYYEDSTVLKRLNYYPYVELLVMLAFVAVVYFAVRSTQKADQNKVWVGLSKETAHQLGTPISSLMAWMELLPEMGVDADTVAEMNKDVARLTTIASRFSKIGSAPLLELADAGEIASRAAGYMSTRISSRISLDVRHDGGRLPVMACGPLFEWVMENLIKNAVDAMPDGRGSIAVRAGSDRPSVAFIEVEDTGRGMTRKVMKSVFNPGFTTKKRGWGLGLTLARRIVEQYHGGKIYVLRSTPGVGTTFRIEIPLAE